MTRKHHVGELTSKLNKACYAIRLIKPCMFLDVLRSTYFSYVHTIISYRIVFWGNSSYSEDIFKIQKRFIRIIMNSSMNASCQQLFKDLNFLPLKSQYIYTSYLYLLLKTHKFLSNSQIHMINTRQASDLYVPTENLTIHRKGVCYSGIQIYTHLATAIKDLSGDKNKFKLALKRCLLHNTFYSLEEYFNT